jgi:hypothetical protein
VKLSLCWGLSKIPFPVQHGDPTGFPSRWSSRIILFHPLPLPLSLSNFQLGPQVPMLALPPLPPLLLSMTKQLLLEVPRFHRYLRQVLA